MELKPGMKVVLKDFEYCKINLSLHGNKNKGYLIALPEEMRKYFELPFVTIKNVGKSKPGHFRIEEASWYWSFHRDWIQSIKNVLPDDLFEL